MPKVGLFHKYKVSLMIKKWRDSSYWPNKKKIIVSIDVEKRLLKLNTYLWFFEKNFQKTRDMGTLLM